VKGFAQEVDAVRFEIVEVGHAGKGGEERRLWRRRQMPRAGISRERDVCQLRAALARAGGKRTSEPAD
jgi:hypothetical protein